MNTQGTIIKLEAPAKVNLCLSVQYPPQDGYHLLDSIFQELELKDQVEVRVVGIDDVADRRDCACTAYGTMVALDCRLMGEGSGTSAPVPTTSNLIFKAVDAMEQVLARPAVDELDALSIYVKKNIPAGGGLGGGSSDAAAAIKACAQLMGVDALDARCLEVARGLGADVAFFLHGGCALMDGRGDTLVRHLPEFPLIIVLMGEHEGISTGRIYSDFDANPPACPDAHALAQALEAFPKLPASLDQKKQLARLCANNLEPAAFDALPRLRQRVQRAQADPDVLHALVTGSGATSYAICPDMGAALRFSERATAYCDWVAIG